MANPIIPGIIRFLHDGFTAAWIGGLILMVMIILPTLKRFFDSMEQREKFLKLLQKRLNILVYISIIGLTVTGILLSRQSPNYQSAFSFANTYSVLVSVKHILIIFMVLITLTKSLILDRLKTQTPTIMRFRLIMIIFNLLLGIAVLFLSGYSSAIGSVPAP